MNLRMSTFFVLATACAAPGASNEGDKGLTPGDGAWPYTDLHVCFVDPDVTFPGARPSFVSSFGFSDYDRERIRETAEVEYSESRTGIHFVGWETCHELAEDVRVDVAIVRSRIEIRDDGSTSSDNFASSIGWTDSSIECPADSAETLVSCLEAGPVPGEAVHRFGRRGEEHVMQFIALNPDQLCGSASRHEDCWRTVVVHELGHIVGLHHEHARREALTDPRCEQYGTRYRTGVDSTATYHGPYDPDSVMSYCYFWSVVLGDEPVPSTRRNAWGLSDGDVATLRELYP